MSDQTPELKDLGWAVLELMGHRRLGGQVREETLAGAVVLRVDVPDGDGFTTQFYGGGALYCVTPTTEAIARAVAARNQPRPVHPFELPAPAEPEPEDADEVEDHTSYAGTGNDGDIPW